ncbi:L,D-transpeptidase family protein [Flavitalea sp. BT771]|uniref:L,D-transpeptidase family protein n=1 Tax=Flavitalea sp. BT771 TaxID=3063329 RepID=UPI0026E140D2|nr:L,D-transpeptidase family protein [Flavitalea sp. BT771]MDO6429484.1 L,D-transpeptidase family protein [Flavitalea sp. BT771]MDV6218388.1 L,D-transpeptidase family protein [Flavitalea sp. BT771]
MMIPLFLFGWNAMGQSYLQAGLVNQFYKSRQQALFWFALDTDAAPLRQELLSLLDSAAFHGLDSDRYHLKEMRTWPASPGGSNVSWQRQKDEWLTDAAIAYLKSLREGTGIYEQVSYDGVSSSYNVEEDNLLLEGLSRVRTADQLRALAATLIPASAAYDTLRAGLLQALTAGDRQKIRQLSPALNLYRWIHHHPFPRCIVVNIASASLSYYEQDTVRLRMKVVVGKPSTRTPRFAAWCDQLILYPYWNVPHKIAVNEFLPVFRKSPSLVDVMNMQLLDGKGKIVDPLKIDWSRLNKDNFPYALRQSTGCDNALGVLKFNLTSPYDVYMHDTNFKNAFQSAYRYYSHGCIRVEKPFELANAIMGEKLDTTFLAAGLKDQQPRPLRLENPVPVFVVYLNADIDADGKLRSYRDIYHLLK